MATETLYATSHLAGDFTSPANAVGNTPSTWAGQLDTNTSQTSRWAIGNPVDPLTPAATQTIRVYARKGSNSGVPTIALNLYENGVLVSSILAATNVTSTTSQTLTATFNTAAIGNRNNVEIEVVMSAAGGSPSARNSAQVSRIEWAAEVTAAPSRTGTLAATLGAFTAAASGTFTPAGGGGGSDGYMSFSGTATDSIGTNDAAALRITGDLDIRILCQVADVTPAVQHALFEKWGGGYALYLQTDGDLQLWIARSAANDFIRSTVPIPWTANEKKWLRATRVAATGLTRFYTSDDGVAWTQFGADVTDDAGDINAGTATLNIWENDQVAGRVYYAEVRNGIDGTIVANPDFRDADQGNWASPPQTDDHGNSWGVVGGTTWTAPTAGGGVSGPLAATLGAFTAAGSGTHVAPAFSGSLAATLGAFTAAASGTTGTPAFDGPLVATLDPFTAAASGTSVAPAFTGALAATLEPFTMDTAQVHEGQVNLFVYASSYFDPWTGSPTEEQKQNMRDYYDFMVVFSPYFDSRLAWFPEGYEYIDMYGVKDTFPRYTTNPEWILEDQFGNDLYLDYACSGGTCPQWAGDVGNPAFRADMIANEFTDAWNAGYPGFHIDDMNMRPSTTDGSGDYVPPIDPRTGLEMTLADWRNYVATFMEEIRAAFPDAVISTNPIWYLDSTTFDDVNIDRSIEATDISQFERGINDAGLTGGTGTYSIHAHFNAVDRIHEHGGVVGWRDETGTTDELQEYQLAAYFMTNNGYDYLSTEVASYINPDTIWSGFFTNLGPALGPRYMWEGLFRRDFQNGVVLINEPGAAQKTVSISGDRLDGSPVTQVTLDAGRGAVLTSVATGGTASDGFVSFGGTQTDSLDTTNKAALQITGDIDIRILCEVADTTPAVHHSLIEKWGGGYALYLKTDGDLELWTARSGANDFTRSTAPPSWGPNEKKWLRATRVAATGAVNFYESDDGIAWTQIGTEVIDDAGAINAGTAVLSIWETDNVAGKVYYAEVRDGIDGTIVANPDFRDADQGDWSNPPQTDDHTNSWDFNGGAAWTAPSAGSSVSGAISTTLDVFGMAGAGTHAPPVYTGGLSAALGEFTAAGSGTSGAPAFDGPLAATLGPFGMVGAGTHTPPVYTGGLSAALGAFSATAGGTSTPPTSSGALVASLGSFGATGAGTHTPPAYSGPLAASLGEFTQTGAGTHVPPTFAGDLAGSTGPFTAAATGTHTPPQAADGTLSATLGAFGMVGAGETTPPLYTGGLSAALGEFSATAGGTNSPPTQEGSLVASLGPFGAEGAGTHTPPNYAGPVAAALASFGMVAAGGYTAPSRSGVAAGQIADFGMVAVGTVLDPVTGQVVATLGPFTMEAHNRSGIGDLNWTSDPVGFTPRRNWWVPDPVELVE